MAKVYMFVYALIIFVSPFLLATFRTRLPCEKDDDCPEAFLPPVMKCVNRFCQYEILE
ncbi:putative Late nodulin [Medicago truncatula]|uniref:Nodule Cysteine-Rich (NCR) secreted peptide n=1 Tax=Medicago truncatula TaxID=3880 RepID=A7KHE2_MEDTR|nr:nodule-specific cysteine-rich peptide 312 [Medicago truncatula]AES88663.1 Nodule Cysteine-Rich (NCR) secreted peptide [Medicago truncatula]AFK39592.1 unknown [Medicago truncatula]RHN60802.1 putative Late nodulin [Medicago truncatula]